MKYITCCKAFNKAPVFVFLTIIGIMLLSACHNVLNIEPPQKKSGVEITVRGLANDARTLLPDPTFVKYELRFEALGSQAPKVPVILEEGKNTEIINDLESGFWNIIAIGYVETIFGTQEAAWGMTAIEVVSGSFTSVTIDISASNDSSDPVGSFCWDVEFPNDKVTYATLYVYSIGSHYNSYIHRQDLKIVGSGSYELNPGYYMVTVELQTEWRPILRTTVIHIYSGMETSSKDLFKYTNADFPVLIKLSGNLKLTIDGKSAKEAFMYVCFDQNKIEKSAIQNTGAIFETGDWEMKVGVFEIPTTVYFAVRINDGSNFYFKELGSKSVFDEDVNGVDFVIDVGTFAMSGNLDVTVNGNPINDARIWVCLDPYAIWDSQIGDNVKLDEYGDWKLRLISFSVPTKIYFVVYASYGDNQVWRVFHEEYVHETDISGIDFSGNLNTSLTLAGNVDITVDGEPAYDLTMYAHPHPGNPWDYDNYYPSNVDPGTGDWSYQIPSVIYKTDLYFTITGYSASGYFQYTFDFREVFNTDITDIDLSGNINTRLALSGNINISVDGIPPLSVQVFVHLDPENPWNNVISTVYTDPDTGDWSCYIPFFNELTDVYFTVHGYYGGSGYDTKTFTSKKVFDTDIGGIDLSRDFSSKFTLSGTIGDVIIKGMLTQYVEIRISTDPSVGTDLINNIYNYIAFPDSGSWSREIWSFAKPSTVYIAVFAQRWDNGLNVWISDGELVETLYDVWDTNIANIDIGDLDFTADFIALSGTNGNVTMGGMVPDECYIHAYLDEDGKNLLGRASLNPTGGSWILSMKAFDSTTPVYIFVKTSKSIDYMWIDDELLILTTDVHDANITGITLGDIDIPHELINTSRSAIPWR